MEPGQNLKKTAYDFIIDRIVNGPLGAGKVIDIDGVSSELQISRTPVKEALITLESEGLVCRQGRYYTVFLPSEEDIINLYEVREVLEAQASRFAAIRATQEQIMGMGNLMNDILELTRKKEKNVLLLSDMNGEFHAMVSRASQNEYLERYTREIRIKLKVVRASLFTSSDRRESEFREHNAIFEAIYQHDPELAWKRMMEHQMNVMKYIREKGMEKII